MVKVEVQNLSALVAAIDKEIGRSRRHDNVQGEVGYTAEYAGHVHEDLQAYHPVGNAKFLERPARRVRNDGTLAAVIYGARKRGRSQREAVLQGLTYLKELSQQEVPVDSGFLRSTAYARVEVGY